MISLYEQRSFMRERDDGCNFARIVAVIFALYLA